MAVITIRLPEETRQQLEQLAHTQNKTLSELARTALEALVRYPDNPYRSDEELSGSSPGEWCSSVPSRGGFRR